MNAPYPFFRKLRGHRLCAVCLSACWLAIPVPAPAQAPDEEAAALSQVRGTVYVKDISASDGPKNERSCGFDFLVIARDPEAGRAVQLKGRFTVASGGQGAVYGWSGVVYEGLRPGAAGHSPGRIDLQPVNGMRLAPRPPAGPVSGDTLRYETRVDADFQVLLASIVRDHGLKLAFSRQPEGALVETTLDLDVSAMQWQNGRVTRQFDSGVPAQMGRCWGSGS